MRIFYVGQISPQPNSLSSRIWEINILQALRASHEVVLPTHYINIFDVEKHNDFNETEFRRTNSEALLSEIRTAHSEKKIDLFLSYFYSTNIDPEVLLKIQDLGIVTMNMYFNSLHQFELVKSIAPLFNFCLVPETEAMEHYHNIGARPIRFPMAANPMFYTPQNLPKDFDVVFIGSRYLNRESYASYLYQHGIEMHVFGPDWLTPAVSPGPGKAHATNRMVGKMKSILTLLRQGSMDEIFWVLSRNLKEITSRLHRTTLPSSNIHPGLTDEEMVKMYSRAKIILNFSETMIFDSKHRGKVRNIIKLRDFEVPMSGGFAITGCQEELHEYYRVGSEIICYRNKKDLLKKVRYYLAHKEEREAISRAGHERALQSHTWEKRFADAFLEAGLL